MHYTPARTAQLDSSTRARLVGASPSALDTLGDVASSPRSDRSYTTAHVMRKTDRSAESSEGRASACGPSRQVSRVRLARWQWRRRGRRLTFLELLDVVLDRVEPLAEGVVLEVEQAKGGGELLGESRVADGGLEVAEGDAVNGQARLGGGECGWGEGGDVWRCIE